MSAAEVGYPLVLCSVFLNGSYLVFYKLVLQSGIHLHPIIFQLYASWGIFISCLLCATLVQYNSNFIVGGSNTLVVVPYGIISGAIIMISICCSLLGTEKCGLAIAQGVIGGAAIVTSYLWGLLAFGEIPSSIAMSVTGILLLVIGVALIAHCDLIASFCCYRQSPEETYLGETWKKTSKSDLMMKSGIRLSSMDSLQRPKSFMTNVSSLTFDQSVEEPRGNFDFKLGILLSLTCGITGGSALVPLHYVGGNGGFVYLPSFGLGAVIMSPVILLVHYYMSPPEQRRFPPFNLNKCLWAGIASGFVWNLNNICAIGAIPRIGFGVAYPITQCAIFVAGSWGIFLFKELAGWSIVAFYGSVLVLLAGAVLLSLGSIY